MFYRSACSRKRENGARRSSRVETIIVGLRPVHLRVFAYDNANPWVAAEGFSTYKINKMFARA